MDRNNSRNNLQSVLQKRPSRPVMRYHGGKWRLAPWIISHFPPHRIYVEPYGGAASVLMRKPPSHGEVYNDLDGDIVNVFRVLRGPFRARLLEEALRMTPFSREEFALAHETTDDPVERARRTLVRAGMGYGTSGCRGRKTGFRGKSYVRNQTGPRDWATWPKQIRAITERLKNVVIECRPAFEVITRNDGPETLFYVDPPYVPETRNSHDSYAFEADADDHVRLASVLAGVQGMVIVSGYPSDLYDSLYSGWRRVEHQALADRGKKTIEVLWLSPNIPGKTQGELFAGPSEKRLTNE